MANRMINALLFLATMDRILCQAPTLECYEGETKDLTKDSPTGLKTCKSTDGLCYASIISETNIAGHGATFGCGKNCKPYPYFIGVQCKFSNVLAEQTKSINEVKDKIVSGSIRRCHLMSESKDATRMVYCPDGKCGWSASSDTSRQSYQGCHSQCINLQNKKEVGFKNPCEECSEDMCNNAAKVAASEEKARMAKPKRGNQTQPVSLLTGILVVISWAVAHG